MVSLGTGQLAIVMPHYPHMMREDTEVWSKFLASGFIQIREVWYDVRVGQSILLGLEADDVDKRIAQGLTRKRIDVVCSVGGGIWVVEVKPKANMYAVGQVITYARLFALEYSVKGQIIPVIVCDEYDVDLVDEFDEFGVLVLKN